MALIEKKDIISQDAEQPLDKLIQQFTEANNAFKELTVSSKALQQALNGVNKENSGDEAKKLIAINAQLIQTNKELESVQKTILTTSNELQRIQQKRIALSTEAAQETAKERVELQNANRQLVTNAKLQSNTTNELQRYKLELRELKSTLLTAKQGTDEYNKALQRAAFLTDELGDMQARVKGTAMDFEGVMSNVVKVTSGFASAFEATQGAMALFGDESEDVQKAMLKVQAAIALANGLQGLDGMGKALKNLGTQMMNFGPIQKTVTTLQYLWNAAVRANPIVAAISAIVALSAAVYGLTKAFSEDTEEIKKNNTASDGLVLGSEELKKAHEEHIEIMKQLDIEYDVITGKITEFQAKVKELEIEYKKDIRSIQEETKKQLEDTGGFFDDFFSRAFSRTKMDENGKITTTYDEKLEKERQKIRNDGIQKQVDKILEHNKKLRNIAAEEEKQKKEAEQKAEEERQKQAEDNFKKFTEKRKKQQDEFNKYWEEASKNVNYETRIEEEELLTQTLYEQDQIRLANTVYIQSEEDRLAEERAAKEIQRELEIAEKKKEIRTNLEKQSIDFASDIFSTYQDEKIFEIQEASKIEEDLLKNKLDKGLITEEQYNSELKKIRSNAKTEEAKAEKKKALFDIAINTAVAAVKALPNWVLSLFVVAQGAIQAAFVAAKPIPKYAKGGKIKGPSHSDGGVLIEAEGNEFMVNKNDALKAPKTLDLINKGLLSDKEILSKKDVNLDYLIVAQLKKNNRINEKVLTAVSNGVYTYEVNGVRHIVFADGSRVMNEFPRKKE